MTMKKFFWIFLFFLKVSSARIIISDGVKESLELLPDFSQVEPRIFESKIVEAFNKFKEILKSGYPSAGIPPLDPFFLPKRKFDFILDDTSLAGYFRNVTFANFSDFEARNVELKLVPFHFKTEIFLKELNINGKYKIVGHIFKNIPINGTGHFISETKNLNLSLYLKPTIVNSSLQIKDLFFEFKALNQKINYTNELENEEYKILDEKLALEILDKVQEKYMGSLVNLTKAVLNHFLLGYTILDLIKIIFGVLIKN